MNMLTELDPLNLIPLRLEKLAATVKATGPGRWDFTLSNGTQLRAVAAVSDGWMVLDAALPSRGKGPRRRLAGLADMMDWNARFDGAKFVLPPGSPAVHLRAEADLEDDGAVEQRIADSCEAFVGDYRRYRHRNRKGAEAKRPRRLRTADGEAPRPELLCEQTDWPWEGRPDGTAVVGLEAPGAFQAVVSAEVGGGIAARVDLAVLRKPTPASCRAAAVLLMTLGAVVRSVRGVWRREAQRVAAGLEVVFAASPTPAQLARAFCGMSLACRLCGAEAGALADREVASEYLVAQGLSLQPNEEAVV